MFKHYVTQVVKLGILDKLAKRKQEERIRRGSKRMYEKREIKKTKKSLINNLLNQTTKNTQRIRRRIPANKEYGEMIVRRKIAETITGIKSGFRTTSKTVFLSDDERRKRKR